MSCHDRDVRIRVAGILISGEGILLIAHKKNDHIYWLLPGGGVDYGETLKEALEREFAEELNINVSIKDLAFISDSIDPAGNRHVVNICFLCEYESGNYLLGREQRLHDFSFFRKEEIAGITIFPPINNELISVIDNESKCRYIGKLWKD